MIYLDFKLRKHYIEYFQLCGILHQALRKLVYDLFLALYFSLLADDKAVQAIQATKGMTVEVSGLWEHSEILVPFSFK